MSQCGSDEMSGAGLTVKHLAKLQLRMRLSADTGAVCESDADRGKGRPSRACVSGRSAMLLLLCLLYTLLASVHSLVMRLCLKAFYWSAFVAGWSPVLLLLLAYQTLCVRGIDQKPGVFGTALKVSLLLCQLTMAGGYTLLALSSTHLNQDLLLAATMAYVHTLLFAALLIMPFIAFKSRYSTYAVEHKLRTKAHKGTLSGNSSVCLPGKYIKHDIEKSSSKPRACHSGLHSGAGGMMWQLGVGLGRALFRLLYWVVLLLFLVVFTLSTCHPYFVYSDQLLYREDQHVYTVQLTGQTPLALYMRCRGQGNVTLVYEVDTVGLAYNHWALLATQLEENYVMCVYDRTYGWSESSVQDYLQMLWQEDDNTELDTQLFMQLIHKANISVPFYYIGPWREMHEARYINTPLQHYVKASILLDSYNVHDFCDFEPVLESFANFQASGIFYPLSITGLLDFIYFPEVFGDVQNTSVSVTKTLAASVRSTAYISSFLRQLRCKESDQLQQVSVQTGSSHNVTQTLIINAGLSSSVPDCNDYVFYSNTSYLCVEIHNDKKSMIQSYSEVIHKFVSNLENNAAPGNFILERENAP